MDRQAVNGCPFRRDCPDCQWSGENPTTATVSDRLENTERRTAMISDSGNRTPQYGGAVRDRAVGKGRFDLLSPFFLQDLAVHSEPWGER